MLIVLAGCVAEVVTPNSARISPNGADHDVAVGKCADLGFAPDLMDACVRAIRADYCGDGTSHTVDGAVINIYDATGMVTDDADWTIEAMWTAAGASCISAVENTRAWQHGHAPSCLPSLAACDGRGHGQVITELP